MPTKGSKKVVMVIGKSQVPEAFTSISPEIIAILEEITIIPVGIAPIPAEIMVISAGIVVISAGIAFVPEETVTLSADLVLRAHYVAQRPFPQ